MQAIRSVYKSSRFYNTSSRITGFLSKVINQLILACQKYLTRKNTTSIWKDDIQVLVIKIRDCKKLKESFRNNYDKILVQMVEAREKPFNCSEKFLFTRLESFTTRLNKILEVMEVSLRYKVLDRVQIAGMESFNERIKAVFTVISEKPYDPLAHRLDEFDTDYLSFQKNVSHVEMDMQAFVKHYMEKIECAEMRLLTLKRFERLNLECLCLDHRYLDVAVMLEKEIEDIKDKYNEERANPLIDRNVPPVIGRIRWARSLLKKMEEPLNVLKTRDCVIEHPKAQLSVKYYNYLAGILFHYEAMHHKAWFTYAENVRAKLEVPLIRQVSKTTRYEVNLDQNVLQVIKETESMFKLGLEIPETAKVLTYCKHHVFSAYNRITMLISRNNKLRKSIYPMFVPLMRVQLVKLEKIFAPALSTLTWLSTNLDNYFEQSLCVIIDIERFVKEVSDINDAQIGMKIDWIEKAVLVHLPVEAIAPDELIDLNVSHRQKMEKLIEMKSVAAERTAIDLINKFARKSGIPDYDDSGKFQLPRNKITDVNWRAEETKPIDKYDWLSFDKLYKAVGYATAEENEVNCFMEYDGLKYDVILLHIDCVELFAYYNHKIIAALARCTKRSMELLKKRSDISGHVQKQSCSDMKEKPLLAASVDLRIPDFTLTPSIHYLQAQYDATLLNIIETHYAVTTWGKQAKTMERKTRKPLVDEVRHEKNWFKIISEHKDVKRYKLSFENGVMQLESKVNSTLSDLYKQYNFLWDENKEEIINNFIASEPLIPDIRCMLLHYDNTSESIAKLDQKFCIKTIEVDCESMINLLVEEAKTWKFILGSKLSAIYREILDEMVEFINKQTKVLSRKVVDLDECRIALNCITLINENFIRMDRNLNRLEESYAMLNTFQISIPPEDTERMDGLRFMFNSMIKDAENVFINILKLQDPLLNTLEANVKQYQEDLANFEADYELRGPTVEDIPTKEASYRVMMFEIRLQELQRRFELYTVGEKLLGLTVNEYPWLAERKTELEGLNKLFKERIILEEAELHSKEVERDTITALTLDYEKN